MQFLLKTKTETIELHSTNNRENEKHMEHHLFFQAPFSKYAIHKCIQLSFFVQLLGMILKAFTKASLFSILTTIIVYLIFCIPKTSQKRHQVIRGRAFNGLGNWQYA